MSHQETLREASHQRIAPSDPDHRNIMDTIDGLAKENANLRARIAGLEGELKAERERFVTTMEHPEGYLLLKCPTCASWVHEDNLKPKP